MTNNKEQTIQRARQRLIELRGGSQNSSLEQAKQRLTKLRQEPTISSKQQFNTTETQTGLVPTRPEFKGVEEKEPEKKGLLKSIRGLGETFGTALATPFIKKTQEELTKGELELQPQVIAKLRDPNVSREQKIRLAKVSGVSPNMIDEIPALKKTGKQVASEALGTLGTAALAGVPGASAFSRVALGGVIGAGAGIKSGLDDNSTAEETIKKGFQGGLIGLATGAIFEGAGRLLSKAVQTKPVKEFVGRRFTAALQPKTADLSKELQNQLQFGWKTTGERIAQATDKSGNPIYYGGFKKMGIQAVKQINNKSTELDNILKQFPRTRVSKKDISRGIIESLEDTFGVLTSTQRKTIDRELSKIITKRGGLTLRQALKAKRTVDRGIPDGFWIEPNAQKAFVGHVKYNIRQNLRKVIEKKADIEQVRRINNELGLALDVKDLVGLRRAAVQKTGIPLSIRNILERTIFSPVFTTRGAQTIGRIGEKVGPFQLAGRGLLTQKISR